MGEISIDPKFNIHETYKKVRILNPYRNGNAGGGGGVDSDYQGVLDYAAGNFIDLPDAAQQDIDNQRMLDYKNSGVYAKADVLLNMEGGASTEFRRIDWKRKIQVSEIGSTTITFDGIKPNSNSYWNLLYNPSTDGINYSLNDAGVLYYLTENPEGIYFTFGALDDTNYQISVMGNRPGQTNVYAVNDNNLSNDVLQKIGMNGIHRIDTTSLKFITDITNNFTTSSGNIPNGNVFLFCRNSDGSPNLLGQPRMKHFAIGANMEVEQANLKAIIEV